MAQIPASNLVIGSRKKNRLAVESCHARCGELQRPDCGGKWVAKPRRAFTLVELLVVVAVMALLSLGVVLSLRGPVQHARVEHAVEQFVFFDKQLRSHARRYDAGSTLEMRAGSSILRSRRSDSGSEAQTQMHLGENVTVDRILTADGETTFGQASIPFTRNGRSWTYAVYLKGPGGQGQWLMFAGMTGQVSRFDDDRTIGEVFRMLAYGRDVD